MHSLSLSSALETWYPRPPVPPAFRRWADEGLRGGNCSSLAPLCDPGRLSATEDLMAGIEAILTTKPPSPATNTSEPPPNGPALDADEGGSVGSRAPGVLSPTTDEATRCDLSSLVSPHDSLSFMNSVVFMMFNTLNLSYNIL